MENRIPNRTTNWRIAILVIGLVIVLAFWLLNFRAAVSNTDAQHNSVTTSIGERLPDAMQQREKITVVISGDGRLADALRGSLAEQIRKASLGEVEVVRELKPDFPNPVLVVEVDQPGMFWTPFFATTQFPIHAGYASNGDTSFVSDTPAIYNNVDGPVLTLSADYQMSDRSYGLMSYPGYHQFLADYLAQSITETVKKAYEPK